MRLDIGCGAKCKEGFEGVDKKKYGQEHCFNIEEKWDIPSSSVDEIFSSHTLEHIKNINFVMSEIYRVCKKNAIITIIVPYFRHEWAFRDPSHVRYFTEHTFKYFNKEYAKLVDYDMEYEYDFEIVSIELNGITEVRTCLKPKK